MLFVPIYFMFIAYICFVSVPYAITLPVSGLSCMPILICLVLFCSDKKSERQLKQCSQVPNTSDISAVSFNT